MSMPGTMGRLTIVVPVLNEAAIIVAALAALAPLRARGAEIIVADGGSRDGTARLAEPFADRIITVRRGRGAAMNAGAALGIGDTLLFLHADTTLPDGTDRLIDAALARRAWGRFDLRIAGSHPLLTVIARMINWRSRLTGIATGDQALFVTRAAFESAGGFPPIALMEDVALSARLRRIGRPCALHARATTSARRWRAQGTLRTVLLMWRLRLRFFFGADPAKLARVYDYGER